MIEEEEEEEDTEALESIRIELDTSVQSEDEGGTALTPGSEVSI